LISLAVHDVPTGLTICAIGAISHLFLWRFRRNLVAGHREYLRRMFYYALCRIREDEGPAELHFAAQILVQAEGECPDLRGPAADILDTFTSEHTNMLSLRQFHERQVGRAWGHGRALGVAAMIAGRRRSHLRDEWAAVIAGDPASGLVLTRAERRRLAAGFVFAAVRMRVKDLATPLWLPVDWLLATEPRTRTFIALAVGGQAIYIVGDGGLAALFTEIWEPCGAFGGALYALSRWLRRVRGIELGAVRGDSSEG
jgi:hypothetical protein